MNTNTSAAQLAANRANAQHSTGPRTITGRSRISLNAVKTGLTGETVVLSEEEGERYRALLGKYQNEFQPVGVRESELVQSLIDLRWRLNRIPGLEAALNTYARNLVMDKYAEMDKTAREFFLTVDVYEQNEKKLQEHPFPRSPPRAPLRKGNGQNWKHSKPNEKRSKRKPTKQPPKPPLLRNSQPPRPNQPRLPPKMGLF